MQIEVFTQSAIKLTGKSIIYFDPYKIKEDYHDADYIFITHDHYDHYDEESLKKVMKSDTVMIVPTILITRVRKLTTNVVEVIPNNEYRINDLTFEAIPAYNIGSNFHPKEKGYVGYNVLIDDTKYYIMGDTSVTEESKKVQTDICFVPIGGYYTMDVLEAADYINYLKPKKVIPIHYGSIVGDISFGTDFKRLINKDIEVALYLKEEEEK